MTSSFLLSKIQNNPLWAGQPTGFSEHDSPLGGLEHVHLKINGNCHPDFEGTPVGNAYGALLCRRKPQSAIPLKPEYPKTGYYRASLNLYDVHAIKPTQDWNPLSYPDRRIPWEADLIRDDYLRLPIKYNADGIKTVRTPHQLQDASNPYFEYGFSFLPHEDPKTGMRIATSLSQTVPPPKYDVTSLHQRFPLFKTESAYVRNPQDFRDQTLTKRIV